MTSTTETIPTSYTSNINDIIQTQKKTLHLFISNPSTRTPVIVLYVATFGGSLHSAVTTYFYLEIGATEIDIGQLGFIISIGALIGAPVCGIALDKYGPWIPISITAAACSVGCLWRGMASSLSSLRLGYVLLGIGNNVFTVVLGHLVKSNPPSLRSEVLSGFAVQLTTLQLLGKGIFPLLEYILHNIVGLEKLFRYRIHMGFCTFFCFYGTIALFFDRKNVKGGIQSMSNDIPKPQQKQSDFVDGLLHGTRRLSTASNTSNAKELELTSTSISDSFIDNDESNASLSLSTQSLSDDPKTITSNTTIPEESSSTRRANEQLITTITLTFALLLQSIANTIFTVLWPLLAHDIFNLSAHTFGILTFISSIISTGAVASFPIIEKLDKVGGRVRMSAKGFGIGSLMCILFCFCSFGGAYQEGVEDLVGVEEYGNGSGIGIQLNNSETRSLLDQQNDESIQHQLHSRKQLAFHFLSAIAFQAILSVLEPSLKSILSLQSSKSKALGSTIGGMQSLLNIGGMVGNLAGTILYKISRDMKGNEQGGSLPFTVTALFMFICSLLIWRLEEPAHLDANTKEYNTVSDSDDIERGDIDRGCASRVLKFD